MPYLAIVPISSEPPIGLTHRKHATDEATFKTWCKNHRLVIIGYENKRIDGVLQRFAAVCSYLRDGGLEHPTIEDYLIIWQPSHTKSVDFRAAWERVKPQTQP